MQLVDRRGHRGISALILLLVFVLTSGAAGQNEAVVPITVERNRTLVTVQIGNVSIPKILLDTGFAFDGLMIYNPAYRDSIDLTGAREVSIAGAGSGEPAMASLIDSATFRLGAVTMRDHRLIVLQNDTFKGFPSNGIIGYSILGHYITALDYDVNTMTLLGNDDLDLDDSWTSLPLYFKDNSIPWIDASVVVTAEPPTPFSMYIDYASGDAIELLEKSAMSFRHPKDTVRAYLGRGLSGDIYGLRGTIAKLIIGPFELNEVSASFAPAEVRSKQDSADAILGHASLSRFNLVFDYAGKRLYIKPNAHFGDPFD